MAPKKTHIYDVEVLNNSSYFLNDGAMLHQVLQTGKTFEEVKEHHRVYVTLNMANSQGCLMATRKTKTKDHKYNKI